MLPVFTSQLLPLPLAMLLPPPLLRAPAAPPAPHLTPLQFSARRCPHPPHPHDIGDANLPTGAKEQNPVERVR
eukprot:COSAG06_NODE_66410_length_254_cov_0.974194_1_plen_72_part_01